MIRNLLISISLICLPLVYSSTSSKRIASPFVDLPPNVFAPDGRLYDVEDAVHSISSDHDPSSTTLVVIKCMGGIVAVTTSQSSPYMLQHDDDESITPFWHNTFSPENNNDDGQLILPTTLSILDDCTTRNIEEYSLHAPFCRIEWPKQAPVKNTAKKISNGEKENPTSSVTFTYTQGRIVLAVTAGNIVESRILRQRIHQTTDRLRQSSSEHLSASTLARIIADQNQQRTQVFSSGKIVASAAVFMDCGYVNKRENKPNLYQVDPSGQFWICQGVVAGRYATNVERHLQELVEKLLIEKVADKKQQSDEKSVRLSKPPTRIQVCDLLSQLSIDDALTLATKCITDSIQEQSKKVVIEDEKRRRNRSTFRLRGIAISINENLTIDSYSHYGLISRIQNV